MFLAVFAVYGQKPLCEMGILKFCQKYESFKMPSIRLTYNPCDISLICTNLCAFTITGVILPKDCTYPSDICQNNLHIRLSFSSSSRCSKPNIIKFDISATEK